ncbi:hypothetical protein VNO80_28896 [Phaseolus coccineus]|uniref:Uncharacterized protein n=1 Tax=Phaseolus coccineus TaxID=3886 RepID=A0AAN9QHZ9_PHACN
MFVRLVILADQCYGVQYAIHNFFFLLVQILILNGLEHPYWSCWHKGQEANNKEQSAEYWEALVLCTIP